MIQLHDKCAKCTMQDGKYKIMETKYVVEQRRWKEENVQTGWWNGFKEKVDSGSLLKNEVHWTVQKKLHVFYLLKIDVYWIAMTSRAKMFNGNNPCPNHRRVISNHNQTLFFRTHFENAASNSPRMRSRDECGKSEDESRKAVANYHGHVRVAVVLPPRVKGRRDCEDRYGQSGNFVRNWNSSAFDEVLTCTTATVLKICTEGGIHDTADRGVIVLCGDDI